MPATGPRCLLLLAVAGLRLDALGAAAAARCPAYEPAPVARKSPWASVRSYVRDAVGWIKAALVGDVLEDIRRDYLNGKEVTVLGCTAPIDDLQCHRANVVPPRWLHLPKPLPPVEISLDFECFQGFMRAYEVEDVEGRAMDHETVEGNITTNFWNMRASFTLRLRADLPKILFVDLGTVHDQEPLDLANVSTKVVFPLEAHCETASGSLSLSAGALRFQDLHLDVDGLHPLRRALQGPLNRLCAKVAGGSACAGIVGSLDSAVSDGLEQDLLRGLPALLSEHLSPSFDEEVRSLRLRCESLPLLRIAMPAGPWSDKLRVVAVFLVALACLLVVLTVLAAQRLVWAAGGFRRLRNRTDQEQAAPDPTSVAEADLVADTSRAELLPE